MQNTAQNLLTYPMMCVEMTAEKAFAKEFYTIVAPQDE
jgi:hypothetical protein